jgi:hypothetical protein
VAGAIDLFSGSRSITGTNLMKVNKSPLDQIDEGIEDVVGKQADGAADQVNGFIQTLVQAILGLGDGNLGLGEDVQYYFGNVEQFLGDLNPLDPNFNPADAIKVFVETMLHPSHMLAPLLSDPNGSAGVIGFVPLENLALSAIAGVIGGAQEVIDAIMAGLGFPPGSATADNVDTVFQNLYAFLANPDLANALMDPIGAIEDFITDMLHPRNMLAPLDPFNLLIPDYIIPLLDATKIGSGQFLQNQVENLESDLDDIWNSIEDAASAILTPIVDWLLPNVPVSSVGIFQPELLANPHYTSADSISGGVDWIWDGAVDHDGDGSGSVKVVATGMAHQLFSDPPIPVSPKQQLHCEHWLTWSSVAGAGQCFKLSVAAYKGTLIQGITDLNGISNPAVNSSNWVKLQGDYTVPASGVDNVRLLITVTAMCTAGTVHWDTGSVKKVQLFGQDFTTALVGDLNNLLTQVTARALLTDFNGLMNSLGLGSPTLTAITNRFANIFDTGLVHAGGLTNMTAFPGIDSNKIISGFLNIARVPMHLFDHTNIFDLGTLNDQITNGLLGGEDFSHYFGSDPTQARGGLDSIFADVLNHTQQIQAMRSNTAGTDVSGSSVNINFSDYPDGPLPAIFTTTYTGSGTSLLGIVSGVGRWSPAKNDGNRNVHACYQPAATNTDFQLIRGSLGQIPQQGGSGGTPKIAVTGRVDSPTNPRSFVWARGYCTGFLTFKGDMGMTVNGVETVWASNIPLTWSMDIMMAVGVGINARRYQVYSGSKLVYDYTEPGTGSSIGPGFRYYGLKAEIRTDSGGTPTVPGSLAGASISDNAPPTVVGSGGVMSRRSTSTVGMPTGSRVLPNNFFGIIDAKSDDITASLANGSFTVKYAGWYHIDAALQLNGSLYEDNMLMLFVNGNLSRAGGPKMNEQTHNKASWLMYLAEGDYVQLGTYRESGSNAIMQGEASGVWTYFQICLANRSYA